MTRASTQQAMDALSTPAMEATFDRIDALLTELLERVKAFDFKISLALTHHSSCPAVLDPCAATDDTEISDGPHFFVRGDSLLPHNGDDDIPGGLLVSEGALMPPETPQPLNDVMDPKGEGSVVIEVGLAGIHKCMPSVAHMSLLSDATPVAEILVQSLVSVYGDSFKIEALGGFTPFVAHESRGLHALHPFVEMQHSGALCHGNAILGVDLSYYMGIRDKGGGFEVLQQELQHKGFIKNGVQDYGCVDDFELFSHMGVLDKRGSFIGWIWRTDLRWFRYKITHISSFSCMNNSAYGKEEVDDAIRLMICIGRCKWGLLSSITCCSYNIWLSFEFHSPGQHN